MKRLVWAGSLNQSTPNSLEGPHTIPLAIWMALLVFTWLHVPTSIQRDALQVPTQVEESAIASPILNGPFDQLVQTAEETLNGGLTPVLGLKTHQLNGNKKEAY